MHELLAFPLAYNKWTSLPQLDCCEGRGVVWITSDVVWITSVWITSVWITSDAEAGIDHLLHMHDVWLLFKMCATQLLASLTKAPVTCNTSTHWKVDVYAVMSESTLFSSGVCPAGLS